jgi:hypothetical protein
LREVTVKKCLVLVVALGLSSSSSALAEQGDKWLGISSRRISWNYSGSFCPFPDPPQQIRLVTRSPAARDAPRVDRRPRPDRGRDCPVATMGAVRARETLGPAFYGVYSVLFLTAIPSLANVLMLRGNRPKWWYVLAVACACAIFALPIVLMQYGVSEALYGINGDDGPFSAGR